MSKENKVNLKASDNELFEVEEIVAFESQTIKDMVEDTGTESVIPLLNVSSKILSKVIEYCRYHALEVPKSGDDKPGLSEDDVKAWDAEFVKVDQATLFDLILVCTFLIFYSLVFVCHFHTCSLRSLFLSLTPFMLVFCPHYISSIVLTIFVVVL